MHNRFVGSGMTEIRNLNHLEPMLNINWKPIEQADNDKAIIAICPSWIKMTICQWWNGDAMNNPCWTTSGIKCSPTHFINYDELYESFSDETPHKLKDY